MKGLSSRMSQFMTEYESRPINFSQVQDEAEDDSVSVSYSYEEGDDQIHQVRRLLEELGKLTFPLKPNGVTPAELEVDVQEEFGELLDEAQKSLKRNLTFIGGIVRGYLRRGQKNDKWIKMIRSTSYATNQLLTYQD